MSTNFADVLHAALAKAGSPVCVGLDPVAENIPEPVRKASSAPAEMLRQFSQGVVHAVLGRVGVVKFQSACYERYGSGGIAALETSIATARGAGLVVILDAKRGDIGVSAQHYAAAAVGMGAHAITVNGYLGPSSVEPYLAAGLGVFVLVRTSNPDSDTVQSPALASGGTVAEMMARQVVDLGATHIGACGLSSAGAVVGATKSADGKALRAIMPNQYFLVPGYGAQGGKPDDVRALLRPDKKGVVVTASRSVIYPKWTAKDWRDDVRAAAELLAKEVANVVK